MPSSLPNYVKDHLAGSVHSTAQKCSYTLLRVLLPMELSRFRSRNSKIYSLPLALGWARAGFHVTGIDIDERRVEACLQGRSWVDDVPWAELATLVKRGSLVATTDMRVLATLDTVCICVPTPLNKTKDPDIGAVLHAVEAIAEVLHPGQLIILESTTYPGTTDELLLPRLSQQNLTVGSEFFLAFSPERTDPGNTHYHLHNTPKVVAGITPTCLEMVTSDIDSYEGLLMCAITPGIKRCTSGKTCSL